MVKEKQQAERDHAKKGGTCSTHEEKVNVHRFFIVNWWQDHTTWKSKNVILA